MLPEGKIAPPPISSDINITQVNDNFACFISLNLLTPLQSLKPQISRPGTPSYHEGAAEGGS
jgi:hypothetical protein